jgi:hypothetical protein
MHACSCNYILLRADSSVDAMWNASASERDLDLDPLGSSSLPARKFLAFSCMLYYNLCRVKLVAFCEHIS